MAGGAVRPRPPGWRDELAAAEGAPRARRMVGRPRPRARRRRRRADHVEGGLDGAGALRGRSGACTGATRGADPRASWSWWDGFDLLLTPTTAEPGPPLGAYKRGFAPGRGQRVHSGVQRDRTTCGVVPLGWPSDGLPRGVQLVAAHGRDDVLIRIGASSKTPRPGSTAAPARLDGTKGAHPPDVLIPIEAEQAEARDAAEEERVDLPRARAATSPARNAAGARRR